jgi:hypothetical protein
MAKTYTRWFNKNNYTEFHWLWCGAWVCGWLVRTIVLTLPTRGWAEVGLCQFKYCPLFENLVHYGLEIGRWTPITNLVNLPCLSQMLTNKWLALFGPLLDWCFWSSLKRFYSVGSSKYVVLTQESKESKETSTRKDTDRQILSVKILMDCRNFILGALKICEI